MNFPAEYHSACRYLVRFGGHGGCPRIGRLKIAAALRAIRQQTGRATAIACRKQMLSISGHFPAKQSS